MKKLIAMLSVVVLTLTGCATASGSNEYAGACEKNDPVIGFVTDTGGIDDKSFNQGTWEGIEEYCGKNNVGATYIETTDTSQVKANLSTMSETEGIEIVVGSGFNFAMDMYEVAKEHPDTKYIIIDAMPTNPETGEAEALDNVASYLFDEQEAGYLAGYVAATKTASNRIGFIGGQEIPPVQKFGWGFVQGAQAANPDVTVDYQYAGTFTDATIGNAIAETMIKQGTDIIFASAGGTNDGIVKAGIDHTVAGEAVSIIGVDRDMYADGIYEGSIDGGDAKSVILTSAVKMVGHAAYSGIEGHFNGSFPGGETITLGLAEDGVGLPAENPNLDDETVQAAKDALAANGEVSVDKDQIAKDLTISINGKL
ncbi:BMP family ABC transporter substrate-binding protein [Mollicutes bacterium LVI A0039]|nr:BMP family ABC transporter substrate-binding protein [Mollicutes bacterium LVI A0039]